MVLFGIKLKIRITKTVTVSKKIMSRLESDRVESNKCGLQSYVVHNKIYRAQNNHTT